MDTFSGVVSVTVLSLKWYQDSGRGEREREREGKRKGERFDRANIRLTQAY